MSAPIFVVEDDFDLRTLCAYALRSEGHDVQALESGRALLERLHRGERPSLILMDLGLPDMDGKTLIEEARAASGDTMPRIIIASGREELARVAKAMGVEGWLVKPYDMGSLFGEVRRVLE